MSRASEAGRPPKRVPSALGNGVLVSVRREAPQVGSGHPFFVMAGVVPASRAGGQGCAESNVSFLGACVFFFSVCVLPSFFLWRCKAKKSGLDPLCGERLAKAQTAQQIGPQNTVRTIVQLFF